MKRKVREFTLLPVLLICFVQGCTEPGWVSRESGTSERLSGIWYANSNTGTVVGGFRSQGTILHTTDAGNIWTKQEIPVEHDLRAVFFTDARTGIAVGDKGTILLTSSGGEPIQEYRQDAFAWIVSLNWHDQSISNSLKQ